MVLPRFEREILLCHILNISRAALLAKKEIILSEQEEALLKEYTSRRLQGEPMAYILGEKEFWSLNFKVNSNVLIPRPETEILVQAVLDIFPREKHTEEKNEKLREGEPKKKLKNEPIKVLDLGTGSGAIALALAFERPEWEIWATDQSEEALALAKENARNLNISNVNFLKGVWFEALKAPKVLKDHKTIKSVPNAQNGLPGEPLFDAIVSNPPYIASDDPHLLNKDLQYEPESALIAGDSGFSDLKYIITHAQNFLLPNGWLFLEHGHQQAEKVIACLKENHYQSVQNLKDYSGNDRIAMGCKKS